jgi:uncharacterized phage infection (PIP) family protein YhgE
MPEELPAESGAPEASESTVDWEQRYKDTHANWNSLNERFSKFEKDPNALIEFIQEKHPDLLAEDDEEEDIETDEDDEAVPLTRAEFEAYKREQTQAAQQQSAQQQYETDFKTFVNDRDLSPHGERAIRATPVKNAEDLKKAVDEWFAYEDGLRSPKAKPRVPHVPTKGQAATEVPNWGDMNRSEIDQYMAERARSYDAQT